jgi:hypothetical protein
MTKRILGALFLALALAGPASAIEAPEGDQKTPQLDQKTPQLYGAQERGGSVVPPAAVTYRGTIFPFGDTDTYSVRLPGGSGRIFTFSLANGTGGFDPVMVIRAAGRTFVVDRNGASRGEVYRLRVTGTVIARVTIGGFRGDSVGRYVLRVTP